MDWAQILGIIGIIIGAVWIGLGMEAGKEIYFQVFKDRWTRILSKFNIWLDHFHKAPKTLSEKIYESIKKDIDKID